MSITNYTSLIDDIVSLDNSSFDFTTEIPFPSPADPFEGYINVTDYGVFENVNTTTKFHIFEYFNYHPWLTYGLCALALAIVVVAVIILVCWLKKNKTRVINESSDTVLTTNYQDEAGLLRWCKCCGNKPRRPERQNSASNLEFYGRPPLPQSAYQPTTPPEEPFHVEPANLGMYIDGIEDVPMTDIPKALHRELPKYRYKKYEVY